MASSLSCVYGSRSTLAEKGREFVCVSFEHSIFASAVVAIGVFFICNKEQVIPGIMSAAVTALSVNTAHLLSHQFWGEQPDENHLLKVARFVAVFFFSIYKFPLIAESWGYSVSYQQATLFTALSIIGIAFDSYMREEEKLAAQGGI